MIYTSFYDRAKDMMVVHPEMLFIGISGHTPSGFLDSKNCIKMSKLAPKRVWWQEWHDKFSDDLNSDESTKWYAEKYQSTVLSVLTIDDVMNDINTQLVEHRCKDACLLCFEQPFEFCHRSLVRLWLNAHGQPCIEFGQQSTAYDSNKKFSITWECSCHSPLIEIEETLKDEVINEKTKTDYTDISEKAFEYVLKNDVLGLDFEDNENLRSEIAKTFDYNKQMNAQTIEHIYSFYHGRYKIYESIIKSVAAASDGSVRFELGPELMCFTAENDEKFYEQNKDAKGILSVSWKSTLSS